VLKSIAQALNLSAEALFAQAGLMSESTQPGDDATETALLMDPDSPSRRSVRGSPCTAVISDRTVMDSGRCPTSSCRQ
jgi:hypothetical protein